MLRLITDFDGPIMDVSDRYYCVYQYCLQETRLPDQIVHQLSKAEFWQLKRSRIPEYKIAIMSGLDEQQARQFAQIRRTIVHDLPYLVHDKIIPGVVEALEKVQHLGIDLLVMTMRRKQALQAGFNQGDLARFFPENRRYMIGNDHNKTTDIEDKSMLMRTALRELPPACDVWMVGDTEADLIAAKIHNVKVIGVLSGIRDRASLELYNPDLIVADFSAAVDAITLGLSIS
jgi:phosphoglycolate phosphatase-like HAD superfamily hydrolase